MQFFIRALSRLSILTLIAISGAAEPAAETLRASLAVVSCLPPEEFETDLLWRFRLDPKNIGLVEKWQEQTQEQTETWDLIRTDTCWEIQAGDENHLSAATRVQLNAYDGIAWYSLRYAIPARLKGRKLTLRFGAVDESCRVYVNGQPAGQHLFEKENDWKTPFEINIADFIDWNLPEQHVAIRVEDKSGLGGIWKRVWLVVAETGSLRLPEVLGSHMVLQCGIPVPVWGEEAPGETVRVLFCNQEKTTRADEQGRWQVKLDAMKAGGPYDLRIVGASGAERLLQDVLVGEVWVGSGQSNMERTSDQFQNDPGLDRMIQAAPYPSLRIFYNKRWQVSSTTNLASFSALMTAFGIRLQQDLNTPVGLLVGASGGTPSSVWVPEEDYRADVACKEAAEKYARSYDLELALKRHATFMAGWDQMVADAKKAGNPAPRMPYAPVAAGESYRGGIGELFETTIRPFIPYAIRGVLWDQGEGGSCITGVDQDKVMAALIAGWRRQWGQGDFPFLYVQKPSGGGCAYDLENPINKYADAFCPLPEEMPKTADGLYRDTYVRLIQCTNAFMVTATDLVSGGHPPLKSSYGARAVRVALGGVYGKPLEVYGPVLRKYVIEGDRIRLSYEHVGKGLVFRNGEKLQGFALAGTNCVYHWADATIEGETVVVSTAHVPNPVAVRYAWGRTHPWANLFNKDGLPALAFRTDAW